MIQHCYIGGYIKTKTTCSVKLVGSQDCVVNSVYRELSAMG